MFNKVKAFIKEVRQELAKVSWPHRNEIWASTSIVILVGVLIAFVIWVMDLLFQRIFLTLFK